MASTLLLFLISSMWVALSFPLMPAAAADEQGGEHCQPVRCGNVSVRFPFGRVPEDAAVQNSCGKTGFQVRCRDNTPYLGYYQTEFFKEILNIFYDNASLLIAEIDKAHGFNLSNPKGCHSPKDNTSSGLGPQFSISPVNHKLIFYNCTKPLPPGGGLVETMCRHNTYVRVAAERSDDGYGSYFLDRCMATVVPVLGWSVKANAINYEQLIRGGFLVTWQSPPSGNLYFTYPC
ncbi:unnamed protein product [Urochloa decumbens]|uniref:Wall-associated receptor kinase galacturonan-binding domain-containing protein n=1 Tax=Urochloa decumbens TaxID=240449 RepID=A0ABC8ZUE0_9POAL